MQKDLKNRIQRNAKALRFISRAQMFQKNRKNQKDQLSYLKTLPEQQRQLILISITGTIPSQLPPISPVTISYYRRSNKPVYKTRVQQSSFDLHPHMTYESLFMLAGIQEMNFSNYQTIVKEFETDLQKYLKCEFHEIRQLATISAGNKIIGREKQIEKIVELDQKQIWVLINHVYERKIPFTFVFRYLRDYNQTIYKSLFEMSNTNDDDVINTIMNDQEILNHLIKSLSHYNPDIIKYTIRILGNIMAQKQEYVYKLADCNILDLFYPFLCSSDDQIRKDVCWALANFVFEKGTSTQFLQNKKMIQKLQQLFQNEVDIKILIELCHIGANIVSYADRSEVCRFLTKINILDRCNQILQIEDSDLTLVCLYLVYKIIEMHEHLTEEYGRNFVHQIKYSALKSKITEKTYSANTEISKLSTEIQQKLQEEY